MSNNDETIAVDGRVVTETANAWLVDCRVGEVWLPKSQVTRSGNDFHIPVWLAKKKGLVSGEEE